MCIAIALPPGVKLAKEEAAICRSRNRDGMGFCYAKDGEIWVKRSMEDFEEFWSCLAYAMENNQESAFLVHFRIATHGSKSVRNCHPFVFRLGDSERESEVVAVVHNGVFSSVSPKHDEDLADSYWFGKSFIEPLPPGFYFYPGLLSVLDHYVSRKNFSKVAILSSTGQLVILGEERGVWDAGRWFSNKSFEKSPKSGLYSPHRDFPQFECETCGITAYRYPSDPLDSKTCWKCRYAKHSHDKREAMNAV
jgi:hypothetical protein